MVRLQAEDDSLRSVSFEADCPWNSELNYQYSCQTLPVQSKVLQNMYGKWVVYKKLAQ